MTPATFSLFDTSVVSPTAQAATFDTAPVNLGVRFTVDAVGTVNQIRFLRQVGIDSGYSAALWNENGTLLAQGQVIDGQSPVPSWQTVFFSPVTVSPGQTYVASYFASKGGYSYTYNGLSTGVTNGPLSTPSSAGVYSYGSTQAFPNLTFRDSNYWVTPVVTTADRPSIASVSPNTSEVGGGRFVTITGTNLATTGKPKVFFGDVEANPASITATNREITVISPGNSPGVVNIRVVTEIGASANTPADDFIYLTPPSAPAMLTATPGNAQVSISWSSVAGVDGYLLYRGSTAQEAETSNQPLFGGVSPVTSRIDTGLNNGQTYFYSVRSYSASAGVGPASPAVSATPGFSAPSGVAATPVRGDLAIQVRWDAVPGATGYRVYRGLRPDSLSARGPFSSTQFLDTNGNGGLIPLQTYYFQVSALFAGGIEGPRSAIRSATVDYRSGYVYSIWNNVETPFSQTIPQNPIDSDRDSVEVGTRFTVDAPGTIEAVRFYRGVATSTGYTVRVWAPDGTLLGSGTTTSDSMTTAGWRSIRLNSPVSLQPGQTYIVSYLATQGGYAADEGTFTNRGFDIGALHLPASQSGQANGVYFYGPNGGFPEFSFNDTNYWVDPVFRIA